MSSALLRSRASHPRRRALLGAAQLVHQAANAEPEGSPQGRRLENLRGVDGRLTRDVALNRRAVCAHRSSRSGFRVLLGLEGMNKSRPEDCRDCFRLRGFVAATAGRTVGHAQAALFFERSRRTRAGSSHHSIGMGSTGSAASFCRIPSLGTAPSSLAKRERRDCEIFVLSASLAWTPRTPKASDSAFDARECMRGSANYASVHACVNAKDPAVANTAGNMLD
jgi:hypothetical protein